MNQDDNNKKNFNNKKIKTFIITKSKKETRKETRHLLLGR